MCLYWPCFYSVLTRITNARFAVNTAGRWTTRVGRVYALFGFRVAAERAWPTFAAAGPPFGLRLRPMCRRGVLSSRERSVTAGRQRQNGGARDFWHGRCPGNRAAPIGTRLYPARARATECWREGNIKEGSRPKKKTPSAGLTHVKVDHITNIFDYKS